MAASSQVVSSKKIYVESDSDDSEQQAASQKDKTVEKSQRRGYECEFMEKPPSMFQTECPLCLQILREPHQVICCGKSYCKVCIERLKEDNKACPTCKEEKIQDFPNKGLQQPLYQFKVRCTHQKEGCEWTGELGELDNHLNLEPDVDAELEGCQYTVIACRYSNIGCNVRLTRLLMKGHFKNEPAAHLALLEKQYDIKCDELERARRKISTLNAKVLTLSEKNTSLSETQSKLTFNKDRLKKFEKHFPVPPTMIVMKHFGYHHENRKEWFSPPFYTDFRGYKMCLRIDLAAHALGYMCSSYGRPCDQDHYLSVQVCLMRGEFDSSQILMWPFKQEVEVEVVSQDAAVAGKKVVIYHKVPPAGNWGNHKIPDCIQQVPFQKEKSDSYIGTQASRQLIKISEVDKFVWNDCMEFSITYAGPYRDDRVERVAQQPKFNTQPLTLGAQAPFTFHPPNKQFV